MHMRHLMYLMLTSVLALSCSAVFAFSQSGSERDTSKVFASDTTKVKILPDDPAIAALDALWLEERFAWQAFEKDTNCLNVAGFAWDSVPKYDDATVAAKLALLDAQTPFNLTYNNYVQAFINLYAEQRRDVTSRVLGMAALYYPLFEEKLDQFDMPLELKHLAVVESALNPNARSRVGATGLWQFMYPTGKMYGLEVDTYKDERRDPLESTIAACRYMLFLYGMYDDWNLVLAAYNSGPGNVNKAIRRSGGKRDYWEIRPYLPRETRGYVPAFIAVNYVMNYAADHNIYPTMPGFLFAEVDTVHICRETTFDQIARVTGLDLLSLEVLNPVYKRNFIPGDRGCQAITLPIEAVGKLLANQESMYEMELGPQVVSGYVYEDVVETHVVRSGEAPGVIAQRYGVSLRDLQEWNNIKGNRIYPGQKLVIRKTVKTPASAASGQATAKAEKTSSNEPQATTEKKPQTADAATSASNGSGTKYHVVRSGDTLWDIARLYPGVSANDIIRANAGVSSKSLKPGQKLRIPPQS